MIDFFVSLFFIFLIMIMFSEKEEFDFYKKIATLVKMTTQILK